MVKRLFPPRHQSGMQTSVTLPPELTAWRRDARRRRLVSTAAAALAISAFILLVDFSSDPQPLPELEVVVLPPQINPEPVVEEQIPLLVVEPIERERKADEPVEAVVEPLHEEQPDAPRDWYAQMEVVAEAVVEENQKTFSLNPVLDQKRRQAAAQFRPSRAPVKKPIWENVVTDQSGRKLLVSGDCYRVIDDPSAVNYEYFRTFGQFMTYCGKFKRLPKELPWVEEIRNRHVYMQGDESRGDVRTDLLAELR